MVSKDLIDIEYKVTPHAIKSDYRVQLSTNTVQVRNKEGINVGGFRINEDGKLVFVYAEGIETDPVVEELKDAVGVA